MEMVKLKMRTVYKTFLTIIGFLILLTGILGTSYLFYDKIVETDSDIEVNGLLSINYIDGKKFSVEEEQTINFSITNSGDTTINYNVVFLKVRGNGIYKLSTNGTLITEGTLKSIDELTTDNLLIDAHETKEFLLTIIPDAESALSATLDIREHVIKNNNFSETIILNNTVLDSSLTDIGEEAATTNESLIKSTDDLGTTYYFRGKVNNNYVTFANLTWRIVRINGDGTVRLILDGETDSLATYYKDAITKYDFETSLINAHLDEWYKLYLTDYADYLSNSKFCSDFKHDEIYEFQAYERIITNKIATLNCLSESFNSNIGLLSIDEVIYAGASVNKSNEEYYLYNKDISSMWYTLSASKGSENSLNLFMVNTNGVILTDVAGNLYRSVRPVINLIKNIEVTGDGTIDNPYVINNN